MCKQTKTAQHTPTPWFINGPGHLQAPTPIIGNRSNGEPIPGNPVIIAKILSENPMNEEFIVHACNAHDELVRELDQTISDMQGICNLTNDDVILEIALQVADRLAVVVGLRPKAEGTADAD